MATRGLEPLCGEVGFVLPTGEETLGDTIRWMVEAGHIPVKKAGRLGTPHAVSVIERHGAP